MRALDHALQSIGLSLDIFRHSSDDRWDHQPPGPLASDEVRELVAVPEAAWGYEVPDNVKASAKKSVVTKADGQRKYEIQEFVGERLHLTLFADEGFSGNVEGGSSMCKLQPNDANTSLILAPQCFLGANHPLGQGCIRFHSCFLNSFGLR